MPLRESMSAMPGCAVVPTPVEPTVSCPGWARPQSSSGLSAGTRMPKVTPEIISTGWMSRSGCPLVFAGAAAGTASAATGRWGVLHALRCRAAGHRPDSNRMASFVHQPNPLTIQNRIDLLLVACNPAIALVLPLLFAKAQAHCDPVVELDLRIGLKRQHHPVARARMLARQVPGNRPPQDGDVDLAGQQVALDHAARHLVGVAALLLIDHGLLEQLVAQQPIDRRRAREDAKAQLAQGLGRQFQQVL